MLAKPKSAPVTQPSPATPLAPTAGHAQAKAALASQDTPRNPWPEASMKRRKPVSTRSFKRQMVESQTALQRFALHLCSREDMAEDLMQETMLKAWAARDQFRPGSNFLSWAFTILRNTWLNQLRRQKKFVGEYNEQAAENILSAPAEQTATFALADLQRAMSELPTDQLEAVMLIGPGDHTYDDAAVMLGCAPGTVKSRVSRARATLGDIIDGGKVKMDMSETEDATDIAETFVDAVREIEAGGNMEDVINLDQTLTS